MTGDACIAGDAHPVDAPDLTPLCGSSCDSTSLYTDLVKSPFGQRYSNCFIFHNMTFLVKYGKFRNYCDVFIFANIATE